MSSVNFFKYVFLIRDLNGNGGQEVQTVNVVNALNAIGVRAVVFSLIPYNGDCKHVFSLSPEECSEYLRISASKTNKLSLDLFLDIYLRKILLAKLREIGCDVLVNQNYEFSQALPFGSEIKVLQVLHWSVRGYEESLTKTSGYKGVAATLLKLKLKFRSVLRLKGLCKSDGIVTLTQSAISEVKDLLPQYKENSIYVIHNPLPYSEDAKLCSTLKNKNICFVGRLSAEKGVMRLLRIWEKLARDLPDYTLSIYGDGPCKGEMEEYMKVRNIQRVKLCGFERDLKKIYCNADLLLSTSDSEGFGLVFIEAFYYGVPVVSFDCPVSPREVIGDAGVLVPCYDERQYADAVVEVLKDSKRMIEIQEKTIDRARRFYSNRIAFEWKVLLSSF